MFGFDQDTFIEEEDSENYKINIQFLSGMISSAILFTIELTYGTASK